MTTTVFNPTAIVFSISEVENIIQDTSSLATTKILNTKIGKLDNKIPDYGWYITTPEFNKLTAEKFSARFKQADL